MVNHYDNTDAGRQYAVHHDEDAQIMAMVDDHLEFMNQPYIAPWSPRSDFSFTTPQSDSEPCTPARPTSSGSNTMFVDWDEYGAPIVTYRYGVPPPRPQLQRQSSAATMFVDLDHDGGVQISYRDPPTHLPSPVEDLTPSREEFMGLGVGTEAWVQTQSVARYANVTPPPLTCLLPPLPARNLSPPPLQPRSRRTSSINAPHSHLYELDGRESSYRRPAPVSQIQLRKPDDRKLDAREYNPYQPPTHYDYPSDTPQVSPPLPPQLHIRQPNVQFRKRDIPPYGGYKAYQPDTPAPLRHARFSKPLPPLPRPAQSKQVHKRGKIHDLIRKLLGLLTSNSSDGKRSVKDGRKEDGSAYQRGHHYA
ncbi:hypothetical protein NX059_011831 [Plenodomus lindquistii]|nr:hypothetical protein NX059_011831 [Plenodomus lindquistii]